MTKLKIAVRGNRAALLGSMDLIAGTVGLTCMFYFDEEWNSLKKKITYKVGSTILGTYDIEANQAVIPSNILVAAGLPLEIGITGYSTDKTVITPTSWCLLGTIKNGATVCPGGDSGADDDDSSTGTKIIYDGGVIV